MASSTMESLTVKKVSVGTKDSTTVFAFMETLSGVESKIRLFFKVSTPNIHYSHRAFLHVESLGVQGISTLRKGFAVIVAFERQ